jgi:hypothetical protein
VLGLAALFLAATTANASPPLTLATPWWDKFTFTITDDGAQQACRYESSVAGAKSCDDDSADVPTPVQHAASSSNGTYTLITIERRFTTAVRPDPLVVETGDTLLGGQVLALAIDGSGSVSSCQVVGKSGDVRPPYGCDEARTEHFQATMASSAPQVRHGYMTVLVYGHEEYPT